MMYEKNLSLLREKKFFSLFDNLAEKAVEAAELLVYLKEDHSKLPHISQELNTLEDEADSVVHQIVQELIYDHSREGEEKADKINRKWLRILMTSPLKEPDEFLERVVLKEVVDILEDTMDQ
ncbi:MAG: hypothetical protein U9O90_02355, partial [Euryarchaeota archaeon]|nr:hypothetical protein [Euryarchaeota archaeon]